MATSTQTPRVPATRGGRFLGFLAVGATGLVVNQLAFWALTDVFGLYYLWGFLLATQFSTAWNFVLLERFVFDGRREGRWARLGWYALMNNIWNVASVPVMYAITTGFGVAHLWANWFVISGMTVVRFAISNRLIWRERGTGTDPGGMVPTLRQSTWSYDIHGIVRIVSETPLPELERFEVPALLDVPDIEVSVSNRGFGGLRRRVSVTEADGHITYIEHLGRFGFAAKIDVETLSQHPGVQAAPSLAARGVHQRGRARGPVGHGAQGLHPRPRRLPADRRSRRADHGAHRHGQDHHVPDVDQATGLGLRVRRHGDHRSRGQGAVLPQAADDLLAHAARGEGRADVGGGPRGAAGAGSAPLEVRPVRRHGVREHQPARGHDERARPDGRAAAEVPRRPSDPGGGARRRRSTSTGSW